jgi:hypothetical protein
MSLIQDHLWQVRAECPGVPEPILFQRYSLAIKDFLHRSEAWRYDLPAPVAVVANSTWPDLLGVLPANTYVVRPVMVKWSDGSPIDFLPRYLLDEEDDNWETATAGTPRKWTLSDIGSPRFYPIPNENGAVRLRVALSILAPQATEVPDALMQEWEEAFAAGALSRLHKMPGKDWSDINLALKYEADFEQKIRYARGRTSADYGKRPKVVRYGGI